MPQAAGVAFDVTITAQDAGDATVNNSFTTVLMSATGSLMEFDWNSDGTYGDKSGTLVAGVKTIKARNRRAETANIVASAGAATTITPASVTTIADVFSKLQVVAPGQTAAPGTVTGVAGSPSYYTVGASFNVTVNAYWNFIPAAPGDTIAITSTDNTSTLPANAALVAGTQGFSIAFNQRGVFTVTATNTSNALITNGVSASIVSALPIVWQGDGSANLWDTNALNWTNLVGTGLNFANGDEVIFDNTGSSTPAVNIVGIVAPSVFTLNSANNYTLASTTSGSIGGQARLTKLGAGTLTLSTSNTYSGGSSFSDGVVILDNANALPTSGTLAMTNSMLVLAANNLTRGSITVGGPIAGFAAVGANRSVSLGNITWGNADFFSGSVADVLVLGRATDSFTLDFQSQIDFGTGGNQTIQVDNGAAEVDIAHWGLGFDDNGPSEVEGTGEFPPTDAVWNTCTKYRLKLTYPGNIEMVIAGGHPDIKGGTKWIGTDGWVHVTRGVFSASNEAWYEVLSLPDELRKVKLYESKGHERNFLDCVKSRKPTITPVETAHHSAVPGHLGLIAMWTGRKIRWDAQREVIIGDTDASKLLGREYRKPWSLG